MLRRFFSAALLFLLVLALTLPVLAIALSWVQLDSQSWDILREMAGSVLPDYVGPTLVLCVCGAAVRTSLSSVGPRQLRWISVGSRQSLSNMQENSCLENSTRSPWSRGVSTPQV